jgi:hypothetical protein
MYSVEIQSSLYERSIDMFVRMLAYEEFENGMPSTVKAITSAAKNHSKSFY